MKGGTSGGSSTRIRECSDGRTSTVPSIGGSDYIDLSRAGTAFQEPNRSRLRDVIHYLDLVHSDNLLKSLCMLFDELVEAKFHIINTAFRQNFNGVQPRTPYLVRCLLDYATAKAFGVRDRRVQEERERTLKSARDNFALVRRLYGLKGYEEMCWNQ